MRKCITLEQKPSTGHGSNAAFYCSRLISYDMHFSKVIQTHLEPFLNLHRVLKQIPVSQKVLTSKNFKNSLTGRLSFKYVKYQGNILTYGYAYPIY